MSQIANKQEQIIKNNIAEWYDDGINSILDEDFTLKKLYNLKGSAGTTRNSLRKIINFDPDSFTDLHPLILANPTTCSTLFPLQAGFFDLVIFDEASQLRIEETFSSAYRGKSIVVSGDSQQMPPSSYFETSKNLVDDSDSDLLEDDAAQYQETSSIEMATKESLLDWAIDEGFHETYLDMHYRSKHPDLIEFSNTCFYGSRLIPMPETITDLPIEFNQINGVFEKGTNEAEGLEVLNILKNKISLGKSVGVATFNLVQRNLILNLIAKERYENPEFNSKMTALIADGFFVKNLENIQGDERDIIIISTTFGKKKDGKFIMNFGPITQKNGHRLLNVIITRAKEKVYLITSIPEDRQFEFKNFIELENRVSGKSGLLAYLQYCKHVSSNNQTEKEDLLRYIRSKININQNAINSNIGLTESPFEEEVYQYLVPEFGKDNIIPQYKCGGFRIDLVVISPISKNKIAIECDGAAYHSSELSWHHDIYRQKQLESQGFIFHRIWSTDWFKNTDSELLKLYNFIKSN
jgi:very-short-patch-repair endonuclease